MKDSLHFMPSVFKERNRRKNATRLLRFFVVLAVFVIIYMNLYRSFMGAEREGEFIGWVEAFYWVLTTMSTLGYGDITFSGDTGRLFSMAVMFTGVFYLFIVLPFAFMEFLYKPFVEYQSGARVPKRYEPGEQKHVILTHYDSISHALMEKLTHFGYPFVLVVDKIKEAQKYHDMGIPVMFGSIEDRDTFYAAGIKKCRHGGGDRRRYSQC